MTRGHDRARRAAYSRRTHEVLTRAAQEGRTRARCQWCDAPISYDAAAVPGAHWADDDGATACPARAGVAYGPTGHQPRDG